MRTAEDHEAARKLAELIDRMQQGDESPAMLELVDDALAQLQAYRLRLEQCLGRAD